MPIPPSTASQRPIEVSCPKCKWSTTWKPDSDAIVLPPAQCPQCGNADLDMRAANAWLANLGAALRPLRGR